jgi:tetratricopeptide (TPR) repeat protein
LLRGELGRLSRELEEYAFIRKYANEYGFTLEQFVAAANRWARVKASDDKKERALKEFWNKNFDAAARLALEDIDEAERELDRSNQQQDEASRRIIVIYGIAGGSFYQQGKFGEALSAFEKIEQYFVSRRLNKEAFAEERAKIRLFAGDVKLAWGNQSEGAEKKRLLAEAAATFEGLATLFSREAFPQEWMFLQERLGDAMFGLGEVTEGRGRAEYFARAATVFDALADFSRGSSPRAWALNRSKMGKVLAELSHTTDGAEAIDYLRRAAEACDDALRVFAELHLQEDWAAAKTNLGNIRHDLGELAEGEESLKQFRGAVAAYGEALKVFAGLPFKEDWASTQYNLGNSLLDLGERTTGETRAGYLKGAVNAYRSALTIRMLKDSPQSWLKTQRDLALTYVALKDLGAAADALAEILQAFPDNREAYYNSVAIYHQMLFDYEKAFKLSQQWLTRHPDDTAVQFIFAENHLTTGRFAEGLQNIRGLLARPEVTADARASLHIIEIACLLALNHPDQATAALDTLMLEVADQPAAFKVSWGNSGTRHYIEQNDALSARRPWLGALFDAVSGENRDAVLKALREVRASFKE